MVIAHHHERVQGEETKTQGVPPLHNGDCLTRTAFERIYTAHPEIKKAELIEGVVYVSSPVNPRHGEPHSDIIAWVGSYRAATPGIRVFDNTSLRLDADNEPQPDVSVFVDPQKTIPVDEILNVIPTLIVEIASSSAAYDLNQKLHVYRRNGVQEYLVLLVHERETRWYRWEEGQYIQLQPDSEGILCSQVMPGLWLHSERFWQGDLAGVLAVLQQGIDTPHHKAFIEQVQKPEG